MNKIAKTLPIWSIATAGLIMGAQPALANDHDDDEIPFDEAEIFFELNDTDGDLGIHALIDGEAWKKLQIEKERGDQKLLNVTVLSRLRRQGLTEIFFESAEPTFDQLKPKKFFKRFPEGKYEVEGLTLNGEELESETELTHVMPAPPQPTVNRSSLATVCDDEDPDYNATEIMAGIPVKIAWPAVEYSHPDADGGGAGVQPPVKVTIHNYEVVVEVPVAVKVDEEIEELDSVFSVILPPDVTELTIPAEFLAQGEEFKYEVLAREESFNQTAVESCFVLLGEM